MDGQQLDYDPEELVTLTGSKGTVKRIRRAELPQYKLPLNYQSQADIYAKGVSGGNSDISGVPEKYRAGALTALNDTGYKKGKTNIAQTASKVLEVLDGKDKYASPQEYQDALNYAASDYNARGFGEGGKNLTGTEKTILSGTLLNQGEQGANAAQKASGYFTGYTPPKKGVVADPEDTIRNKMVQALKAAGQDVSKYEKSSQASSSAPTPSGNTSKSIGGFVSNIGTNTKDIANALLGIPGAMVKGDIPFPQMTGGTPVQARKQAEFALNAAKAVGNDLNETAGRPLEGGDILGRAGEHAYQKPVDTAMWVLPPVMEAKGLMGAKFAEGAKGAEAARAGVALPEIAGNSLVRDLQGRTATSLASKEIGSEIKNVSQAEELSKTILQSTRSNTTRGIANEIERTVMPKTADIIDRNINQIDNAIGPMPKDQIIEDVISRISKSSEAAVNPQLVDEIRALLRAELKGTALPGGTGEISGTTASDINNARKLFNEHTRKWYDTGRPTGTPTNDLNSLKADASRALKDILIEADANNVISDALKVQQSAIELREPLSKKALTGGGRATGLWSTILNTAEGLSEPFKIMIARGLQGEGNTVSKQLRGGTLPPIEAAPSARTAPPEYLPVVNTEPLKVLNEPLEGGGSKLPPIRPDFIRKNSTGNLVSTKGMGETEYQSILTENKKTPIQPKAKTKAETKKK